MLRRLLVPPVAAVALAGALAGCGGIAGSQQAQPAGRNESATTSGGMQHLTVSAGNDIRFAQTQLFANPGLIDITLDVTGSVPHNLAFSDGPMGSTGEVSKGTASTTLRFTKPGVYHFLCTIHPQMVGTLTIR